MPPVTQLTQLDFSRTYTYTDYLTWKFPERVELIQGRVRPMSPITWRVHQEISGNLVGLLHALRRKISHFKAFTAPFDVRLPQAGQREYAQITTVVQPDLSIFYGAEKLDESGGTGAPDWIIEILSPETMDHAIRTKFSLYQANGVREYWLVTPGLQNVVIYLLENGRYQLQGAYFEPGPIPVRTLPGCRIEWAEVFEDVER